MARIFRVETECRHGLYDSGFSIFLTHHGDNRHPTPSNDGFKGDWEKIKEHHFGFASLLQCHAWIGTDLQKVEAGRRRCQICRDDEDARAVLAEYRIKKRDIVPLGKQIMFKRKNATHVADHPLNWHPPLTYFPLVPINK